MDQRHAAYHVAGQAVMAFYLGGWVNDEGLEINERRYCGFCFSFGHDAQAKERFLLLCDLAGWRAEHLWHGKGSSRDGYPDEELFAVLEDRRQGWDDYDGDDAELGWDWPISRRAKEPVTMERGRSDVCRYGGSFPIACRCAAVSSIKLTHYPFGIALQTQSGCALRR